MSDGVTLFIIFNIKLILINIKTVKLIENYFNLYRNIKVYSYR